MSVAEIKEVLNKKMNDLNEAQLKEIIDIINRLENSPSKEFN
jgi:DNA-directed RNA polymerase subunit F